MVTMKNAGAEYLAVMTSAPNQFKNSLVTCHFVAPFRFLDRCLTFWTRFGIFRKICFRHQIVTHDF